MKSGIYKITNKQTARFYIGSSADIEQRWESHKRDLRDGTHINRKLQNAWNFYGEENFSFDLIEEVDNQPTLLLEREQHYLDTFKPYERTIGYNICPTSFGGDNFTHNPRKEEIRKCMSGMWSGEGNPMFGKKHTKSSIKKQKEKAIGRYTLKWFIERYGVSDGEEKFEERRLMLMNRPKSCFSHTTSPKRSFKGRKHKKSLGGKQRKTRNYFRDHWEEFEKMVKSGNYSQRQLSSMLGISRPTIMGKMKKILGQ